MRVLFISKEGDALGVAQRLALEGNTIDFFCADPRFHRAGVGLVNRIDSWRPALRRADLILSDCVGLGRFEDVIHASGRPSIGFSAVLDRVELDRQLGMELFTRAGLTIPETVNFSSRRDAATLPTKSGWGDGWVVKANGNISTAKTAVVKDQAQWARAVEALPDPCSGICQRLVSGIEVSTECWFNGNNFIRPFNHTFEEKRLMNSGLGQNTGCMGNVVLATQGNKLTRETVERVEPFLRLIGYRGPFDINCIVNKDGAHALEATSRMGYDAVEALLEGLDEPAGDFLFDVAMGTKKDMALTADTMIAVRLSVPPWPMAKPNQNKDYGEPVLGINDSTIHHLFLTDVYEEKGEYFTAGGDGVLLKATAVGAVTPAKTAPPRGQPAKDDYTYEARRRVYRLLDRIKVSNKQYRTDIGSRVNDEIVQLKQWGWL